MKRQGNVVMSADLLVTLRRVFAQVVAGEEAAEERLSKLADEADASGDYHEYDEEKYDELLETEQRLAELMRAVQDVLEA